jgi:hypothetical protein
MASVSDHWNPGISVPAMPFFTIAVRSVSVLAFRRSERCRLGPEPPVPSVP